MNAVALLAAAREAAEALAKASAPGDIYRYIQLGVGLPIEVIQELATLAGVTARINRAAAMGEAKPNVVVSVDFWHAGIQISAQGHREPTAEELRAVTVYPREVVEDRATPIPPARDFAAGLKSLERQGLMKGQAAWLRASERAHQLHEDFGDRSQSEPKEAESERTKPQAMPEPSHGEER